MNRRKMLSAAPAAMLLASTATAGASQLAEPKAMPSFYATLDPEQPEAVFALSPLRDWLELPT